MLFRQRERFERSDVPRESPYRNVVAVVVLILVFIGLIVLTTNLWAKANRPAATRDKELSQSIASQSAINNPDGYVANKDVMNNILVLTVDDATKDHPSLQKAQLVVLDATKRSGSIATLPLDLKLGDGDSATTLAQLFDDQGASACVVALSSATNIKLGHVLLATEDIWQRLASMRHSGVSALIGSAADVLATIKTDMKSSELMSLAELVQSIGINNLTNVDAPVEQEDNGLGGQWSVVDSVGLGVALNTLVPAE